MSTLNKLIDAIRAEASFLLEQNQEDSRVDLGVLFVKALRKTLREIGKGADTNDFSELTVINLIIMGAEEGYSADEMRAFIQKLKSDES